MGTSARDGAPRRLTPAPAQSAAQTAFLFATVECAAPLHSARASESTGVVCKAGCRPWVSGQTDARTHIGVASTRPTFVHSETVRGLHARGRAHSARASESNGVV